MKLFDRLKEWMGIRKLLRDLPVGRKPIARNLGMARKVAIVYVVEDEAAHNHVRNYVKRIKEELGLSNIMALGYSDQKVMPHYLHAKLNFNAICQKDLNWYRIPQGNTVQNFMAEEFEIIIDLTMQDRLPIQYIMAKSRARFKVGRWSESNKKILDMMIDMAGSQSLPQLIQQIHHYLLMVNAKPEPSLN
ncbi:MAG: hypothetical protein IPP83_01915 [Flavobacteriales bacterium]|nr:hypothetical protein [Flavobacteriales bacterium]MBL0126216.1 hypothetical protein [Flavobacteriales bacterium]MCC6939918.1 hypothetical protein [Flavobacteriales bacterium]